MDHVAHELRSADTNRADQSIGPIGSSARYQLLDIQFLGELYGGDKEYAGFMLETFLDSVLPEFALVHQQILAQNWEEVYPLTHKLRPTLPMVGLTHLEAPLILIENLLAEREQADRINTVWQDFYTTLQSQQPLLEAEWQRYLTTPDL